MPASRAGACGHVGAVAGLAGCAACLLRDTHYGRVLGAGVSSDFSLFLKRYDLLRGGGTGGRRSLAALEAGHLCHHLVLPSRRKLTEFASLVCASFLSPARMYVHVGTDQFSWFPGLWAGGGAEDDPTPCSLSVFFPLEVSCVRGPMDEAAIVEAGRHLLGPLLATGLPCGMLLGHTLDLVDSRFYLHYVSDMRHLVSWCYPIYVS